MNKLLAFILTLVILGCNSENQKATHLNNINNTNPKKGDNIKKRKNIGDYISDNEYHHWTAKHPDTAQYLCEITFHKEYLIHWYHGQCQYFYFSNRIGHTDTIAAMWSYKTDCVLDMDFLEKSHGVKSYPKSGDYFATYALINDTTIHVKYEFPAWTKKINELEKDSIFPNYYYLKI